MKMVKMLAKQAAVTYADTESHFLKKAMSMLAVALQNGNDRILDEGLLALKKQRLHVAVA